MLTFVVLIVIFNSNKKISRTVQAKIVLFQQIEARHKEPASTQGHPWSLPESKSSILMFGIGLRIEG